MEVCSNISQLRQQIVAYQHARKQVGLVPTMGALHAGHMALVHRAVAENDVAVATIFVNPAQFNNNQDLQHYPRQMAQDLEALEQAGCHLVFTPTEQEMYPQKPQLNLHFGLLEKSMEGTFRPGHFSGVGLIVGKLFNLIQPHNAYFGQKDLQQVAVIKRLTEELNFPVQVIRHETVREADGLALSSRNQRIVAAHRPHATAFYKALKLAQQELLQNTPVQAVKQHIDQFFAQQKVATLEYFEVVNHASMQPVNAIDNPAQIALCIAGYLGDVRLIDNLILLN